MIIHPVFIVTPSFRGTGCSNAFTMRRGPIEPRHRTAMSLPRTGYAGVNADLA